MFPKLNESNHFQLILSHKYFLSFFFFSIISIVFQKFMIILHSLVVRCHINNRIYFVIVSGWFRSNAVAFFFFFFFFKLDYRSISVQFIIFIIKLSYKYLFVYFFFFFNFYLFLCSLNEAQPVIYFI